MTNNKEGNIPVRQTVSNEQCPFLKMPVVQQNGQAGFVGIDFCGLCMFHNHLLNFCALKQLITRTNTIGADMIDVSKNIGKIAKSIDEWKETESKRLDRVESVLNDIESNKDGKKL